VRRASARVGRRDEVAVRALMTSAEACAIRARWRRIRPSPQLPQVAGRPRPLRARDPPDLARRRDGKHGDGVSSSDRGPDPHLRPRGQPPVEAGRMHGGVVGCAWCSGWRA